MGAFEYSALDASGRQQKGILEGDTPRQVRQKLRDKGWVPLAVDEIQQKEKAAAAAGGSKRVFGRSMKSADLTLVTRQISTLLSAGLPVEEALGAVSRQTEKSRVKSIIMAVRSRVMEGYGLAVALGDFPAAFPHLYRATVAAGEQSGHLDGVLERLADYTEQRQKVSQEISMALIYPAVLVIFAFIIVMVLLAYVVPQVVQVFASAKQTLPILTRILIVISDFLQSFWFVIVGGIVAAIIAFRTMMKQHHFRYSVHHILLRLPFISKLTKALNAARFSRTFSILTGSGVPVLEAIRISAEVMLNLPMREAVMEAARKVREGTSISKALEQGRYFPPMTLHLIASGEASGRLEQMLDRAASNLESELQATLGTALALLGPLVIIAMGGMVMLIMGSILWPIFELNQLVK